MPRLILCPKCNTPIHLTVERDTTINCPKCGKAISIHFKTDENPFKIVGCPKCGNLQIVKARKTFKCRYCGYTIQMHKLRIYASAKTSREASQKIMLIKRELHKK